MFEDLKQNNQGGQPTQGNNLPPQAPSPAPVTDMFADVEPVATPQNGAMNKPSAVQSGKMKPVSNNAWSVNTSQLTPDQMMVTDSHSGLGRKILVAGAVVLLLVIIGGGAYYFLRVRIKPVTPSNNTNTNINTPVNNNQNTNLNNNNNTNGSVEVSDSDYDGLSDEEERTYGTNLLSPDTDNDGLSDRDEIKLYETSPLLSDTDKDGLADGQEVKVWATDPKLTDTDGDSYLDGQEVNSGYNPKGPGKLSSTSTIPGLFNVNVNTNTNTNQNLNANANINLGL